MPQITIIFTLLIIFSGHGKRGSNSRHLVLETSALPTELFPYTLPESECKDRQNFYNLQRIPAQIYTKWHPDKMNMPRKGLCYAENFVYLQVI